MKARLASPGTSRRGTTDNSERTKVHRVVISSASNDADSILGNISRCERSSVKSRHSSHVSSLRDFRIREYRNTACVLQLFLSGRELQFGETHLLRDFRIRELPKQRSPTLSLEA